MTEHGFTPEEQGQTPEVYREHFENLLSEMAIDASQHVRRNKDGTHTRLTSYYLYVTEESIKRAASVRVLGFLAGLTEAMPPFIAGFAGSSEGDGFPAYSFIHLAYEETLPAGEPKSQFGS